ncbi:TPA: LTA synthase family protein, partial [Neisseria meningitidis]
MNIHTLLSKQWTLPPFLPKRLLLSLLILLAPNAVFWVLALLTATARPIVNLDYLPAALLIALPWRFVKIAGVLAFWLAVLFDGLMMVIQLFPFMDLIGAINLVPFILTAPAPYQIMTGLLLLYMLAMPFVLQKAAAKTDFRHIAVCAAVVAAAGYFTGHLSYYDRGRMANIFGANNFYYAKSQAMLYTVSQNADFITAGLVDPVFLPLGNQQRAATHLNEPKSQKILFIVAESWGLPANPELQNATFAKLLAQK